MKGSDSLSLSSAARRRIEDAEGGPFFICDWNRVLLLHYEVSVELLQPLVPLPLDLFEGRAFVSFVAFSMENVRPRKARFFLRPIMRRLGIHPFLNLRAYVTRNGEPCIYFLAEWLPSRLSVLLAPKLFGLPCRLGRLDFRHDIQKAEFSANVTTLKNQGTLAWRAGLGKSDSYRAAMPGSFEEFLLERYGAIAGRGDSMRLFRIWHKPWLHAPAVAQVADDSLLRSFAPCFSDAKLAAAHYCPRLSDIWVGRSMTNP